MKLNEKEKNKIYLDGVRKFRHSGIHKVVSFLGGEVLRKERV